MSGVLRLLLIGPAVVLILMAFLAVIALLAGAAKRLERLTSLGLRAARLFSDRGTLLVIWGLAALLLTLLASAVLVNIKPLALLGVVGAVLGLSLAAFGLGIGAARCGQMLANVLGRPQSPPLLLLVLGLATFFLAAFIPFLGWLVVAVAVLGGIGATLETLFRRETL